MNEIFNPKTDQLQKHLDNAQNQLNVAKKAVSEGKDLNEIHKEAIKKHIQAQQEQMKKHMMSIAQIKPHVQIAAPLAHPLAQQQVVVKKTEVKQTKK